MSIQQTEHGHLLRNMLIFGRMLRELGIKEGPRRLLSNVQGLELREMDISEECCGFGGTFAVKQADISGAMVSDKTDALRETGASLVISQDCGCLMNIDGALQKQGHGPATKHIAEFLWERCHEPD